jgi:hypothetical protein
MNKWSFTKATDSTCSIKFIALPTVGKSILYIDNTIVVHKSRRFQGALLPIIDKMERQAVGNLLELLVAEHCESDYGKLLPSREPSLPGLELVVGEDFKRLLQLHTIETIPQFLIPQHE